MEEYIKKLLEQIRFRKAHKAIGDEIRLHIEEQISANISDGMDKETAEKRAVEDMGDPVDAGIALDKVHRPQIALGVIVIAIALGMLGMIVNVLLQKAVKFDSYDFQMQIFPGITLNRIGVYISYAICGMIVMLLLYLIDYTTIAKYSKVVAITLLVCGAIAAFINYKSSMYFDMMYEKYFSEGVYTGFNIERPLWYIWGNRIFGWSQLMLFWIVPLFAGILYKFRGQKSRAVSKAILWIIATSVIAFKLISVYETVVIVICMLVELTIAIKKDWIKVPKVPTLISVWSLFTVGPAVLIWSIYKNLWFLYKKGLIGLNEMTNIRMWFNSNDSSREARQIIEGMKFIGSGHVSAVGGRVTMSTSSLVHGGGDVLIDMVALWGLLASLAAIAAVSALIVYAFVTVSKTKNQLGIVMGSGSMMWLAVNAICNVFVEFGIFKGTWYTSFFPFLSMYRLIASYALLGIILSIYKYKNAYPQHVDISIRSKLVKSKTTE